LFLVEHKPSATRLQPFCNRGFTETQLQAAVQGRREIEGTALSQVWHVIAKDSIPGPAPILREQPLTMVPEIASCLDYLCVGIDDPVLDRLTGVIHFERKSNGEAGFDETAAIWVNNYGLALSHFVARSLKERPERRSPQTRTPVSKCDDALTLVGDSVHIEVLREELQHAYIPASNAPEPDPILILGERGTGKDLVARYIHAHSVRSNRPYIAVNCAEITDELAASRFFGYKKGSFTGSLTDEPGFFRAADGGVLFLDEIGELSLRAQATLLRVLENRTVVPIGETRESRVDVQVILATNRDPQKAIADGSIRVDLLDRFGTQAIRLAPLRDRPEDIPTLARHFLAYHERRMQKKMLGIHPDALRMMVGYSWPGNVRELARVCSLLLTHAKPETVIDETLVSRLIPELAKKEWNPKAGPLLLGDVAMRDAVKIFLREMILSALRQHNWNVRSARQSLRLPKTTFRRYVQELGISIEPRRRRAAAAK